MFLIYFASIFIVASDGDDFLKENKEKKRGPSC